MEKAGKMDRLEWGLLVLLLVSTLLRFNKALIFDQIFLFVAATCYLYYTMRMVLSFKSWGQSKQGSILNFLFLFVAASAMAGMMFLLMLWPGGKPVLLFDLAISPLIAGLAFLFVSKASSEVQKWGKPWFRQHFVRMSVLVGMMLFLVVIPADSLHRAFGHDTGASQHATSSSRP